MVKKISSKYILGIDIDDTLWNLIDPWIEQYNQMTSSNLQKEKIRGWDIASYVNPNHRSLLFSILNYPTIWNKVNPIADSQECLEQLYSEYDVRIVTASHYISLRDKLNRFLDLYPFVDEKKIIITQDKQLLRLDGLIDDGFHNHEYGAYNKFMLTQPWNEDGNVALHGITRVNDWKDTVEKVHTLMPL